MVLKMVLRVRGIVIVGGVLVGTLGALGINGFSMTPVIGGTVAK